MIRTAVRAGRPRCTDVVPGSPLRHFLYKSRGNVQFTMPSFEPYFRDPVQRRRYVPLSLDSPARPQRLTNSPLHMQICRCIYDFVPSRPLHSSPQHSVLDPYPTLPNPNPFSLPSVPSKLPWPYSPCMHLGAPNIASRDNGDTEPVNLGPVVKPKSLPQQCLTISTAEPLPPSPCPPFEPLRTIIPKSLAALL